MSCERCKELEHQLSALDWQPITAENLPKVGDEVGGYDPAEAIPHWRVRVVTAGTAAANPDWKHLGYQFVRPINAPKGSQP